jgi:hypothetical protein
MRSVEEKADTFANNTNSSNFQRKKESTRRDN